MNDSHLDDQVAVHYISTINRISWPYVGHAHYSFRNIRLPLLTDFEPKPQIGLSFVPSVRVVLDHAFPSPHYISTSRRV